MKTQNEHVSSREEMREAAFACTETRGFPLALTAGFAKSAEGDDELKLIGRIELRGLRFRDETGRRRNNLTIMGAVFDRNGNYVAGGRARLRSTSRPRCSPIPPRSSASARTSD